MDNQQSVPVIEDFLEQYNREYDHYAKVASLVQQKMELGLSSLGVRAIVTSRAKSIGRLRGKLHRRHKTAAYTDLKSVQKDIIDLAGARVALYFPGDRSQVAQFIADTFNQLREPKSFPEARGPQSRLKRFQGYNATHYLLTMKHEKDGDIEERYCKTMVEVQVASVLMHAWSEVEHDLEYKPETGTVSQEESAILDELNGQVLVGELTLERLQEALRRRIGRNDVRFQNQYDLASYLSEIAKEKGASTSYIGRVDLLFSVLSTLGLDGSRELLAEINRLSPEDFLRPLADSLLDQLSLRDGAQGEEIRNIMASRLTGQTGLGSEDNPKFLALGRFLNEWQILEKMIEGALPSDRGPIYLFSRRLESLEIPPSLRQQLRLFQEVRNRTVHGRATYGAAELDEFSTVMRTTTVPELNRYLTARGKKRSAKK